MFRSIKHLHQKILIWTIFLDHFTNKRIYLTFMKENDTVQGVKMKMKWKIIIKNGKDTRVHLYKVTYIKVEDSHTRLWPMLLLIEMQRWWEHVTCPHHVCLSNSKNIPHTKEKEINSLLDCYILHTPLQQLSLAVE